MLKRVLRRLRAMFFPTPFDRAVQSFFACDGDHAKRLDYPLSKQSIVFDVGGYEGQFASDIFAKYLCTVWVFEPVAKFAERIRHRFACNASIHVCPFGLGSRNRIERFALAADGTSNNRDPDNKAGVIQAEIRSVASFIEEHALADIDLLKVNIEGGEYELLDALDAAGMIKRFRFIQVQFHRTETVDERKAEQYYATLAKTHDLDWAFRPFVWESWRRREPATQIDNSKP